MNRDKFFAKLERWAARWQGKGLGGTTYNKEVTCLQNLMATHGYTTPRIVFDGGANVGEWTQAALPIFKEARFFLFEPSHKNIEVLKSRFSAAPVRVVPLALSSTEGTATLYSDHEGSGLGSLYHRELRHFDIDYRPTYEITTTTINRFMQEEKLEEIDILKLDVEGHELSVMQGASDWLSRIKGIQFEFGGCNIDSRTYFRDFWYLLSPHFFIYRLAKSGTQLIPNYSESDEHFLTTIFYAIKR